MPDAYSTENRMHVHIANATPLTGTYRLEVKVPDKRRNIPMNAK